MLQVFFASQRDRSIPVPVPARLVYCLAIKFARQATILNKFLGHQLFDGQTAKSCCFFHRPQLTECGHGRFDQRDRIIGPVGLCQNIVNSARFTNSSHGLTGDDSGTSPGRDQRDLCRSEAAPDLMRDTALDQGNIDHVAGCLLGRFLNAWGNFVCFPVTPTDFPFAVTDDDHRGKAKATTTFDDGRTAFDLHHAIEQPVIFRILGLLSATATILVASCTNCSDP